MHGEYYSVPLGRLPGLGSPPYARGIFPWILCTFHPPGITPVCTGNTISVIINAVQSWDHPRMHGEYKQLEVNKC